MVLEAPFQHLETAIRGPPENLKVGIGDLTTAGLFPVCEIPLIVRMCDSLDIVLRDLAICIVDLYSVFAV